MLIYYDNQADLSIKERQGKITLPNGDVINCRGAKPDPARDLYAYVEEGPKRAAPGKRIDSVVSVDGWNYTVSRFEVDNPDFDLDAFKTQKILAIKQEAGAVILAAFPDWKQRNMNMRATELQEVRLDGGTLSIEEQAESDALKTAATWIKAVRSQSDSSEAEVVALPTAAGVDAYTVSWPTLSAI